MQKIWKELPQLGRWVQNFDKGRLWDKKWMCERRYRVFTQPLRTWCKCAFILAFVLIYSYCQVPTVSDSVKLKHCAWCELMVGYIVQPFITNNSGVLDPQLADITLLRQSVTNVLNDRRVFSGNQLHWYWQPRTRKGENTKNQE